MVTTHFISFSVTFPLSGRSKRNVEFIIGTNLYNYATTSKNSCEQIRKIAQNYFFYFKVYFFPLIIL